LIEAFMPVWEKIYFQEPEGILFRLPVDPVALGVPVSKLHLSASLVTVIIVNPLQPASLDNDFLWLKL